MTNLLCTRMARQGQCCSVLLAHPFPPPQGITQTQFPFPYPPACSPGLFPPSLTSVLPIPTSLFPTSISVFLDFAASSVCYMLSMREFGPVLSTITPAHVCTQWSYNECFLKKSSGVECSQCGERLF